MSTSYTQCGRCGSILTVGKTPAEAAVIDKEHLQGCSVYFYSS